MNYLEHLPFYVYCNLAENLAPQDLERLNRVSKKLNEIFNSDLFWLPWAQKLGVRKAAINPIHQMLLNIGITRYLPNFFNFYLYNDYKHVVLEKLVIDIRNNWPKEFLTIFDGAKRINRLPLLELTVDQLIPGPGDWYTFKEEHFISPLVRVVLEHKNGEKAYFMLFRIRNNETQEIYHNVMGFFSDISFDVRFGDHQAISGSEHSITLEKLNRLKRLINKEPTGLILYDSYRGVFDNKGFLEPRYYMEEGPTTTSDGKSVLELV